MIEARNWLRVTVFSFSMLNNIISSSGMPQCQDILRRVSQLICEGMFYVSLNNSVSSLPPPVSSVPLRVIYTHTFLAAFPPPPQWSHLQRRNYYFPGRGTKDIVKLKIQLSS